jgi:cytoskeletal protein CcmA (bactofilin family)
MGLFGKKDQDDRPPVAPQPVAPKVSPKAAAKSSSKDMALDTTYFGKNLKIKGNVSGEGSLIILGSFEGEFDLKGRLKVAQGARIKGNIKATDIYVNGSIEGTIAAGEKVHLDNTARIKGGIATPRISVLEGAMFDGEIKMTGRSAQESKPAPAAPKQVPPASAAPGKKETEL